MSQKHKPLFSCTGCSDIQTFPAEDLRQHGDDLWCGDCWDGCDMDTETGIEYTDLPEFVPEADQKILVLTDGLENIKMHMALSHIGQLGTVWHIADAALNKAEEIGK